MKAGDLVELSAYGKKLEYLHWLPKDATGLVIAAQDRYGLRYRVLWYGREFGTGGVPRRQTLDRKCLKHAKVKK
jgi:hypothetical protein